MLLMLCVVFRQCFLWCGVQKALPQGHLVQNPQVPPASGRLVDSVRRRQLQEGRAYLGPQIPAPREAVCLEATPTPLALATRMRAAVDSVSS